MAQAARRIAVTGGPGAGKTTLWRALSMECAAELVAVPEVATLMFHHIFPQVSCSSEREAVQRAIFAVQKQLESFHEARLKPGQVLLCDRGTPDGGGYWPSGHQDFFRCLETTHEQELARYDAVLFMESAALGGFSIAEGNHVRMEDLETAVEIDRRLRAVWGAHPHFVHVPHERDFQVKIARGVEALNRVL
ncbi:MAG: ATP-binding protein [Myxococcales bacterium]